MVNGKKFFIFALALVVGLLAVGMVSGAVVSMSVNSTASSDNFFSNASGNRIVNIIANVTNLAAGRYVYADFSGFTPTINCGNGLELVNLTNDTYGGTIYNGSCDIGDEAALANFEGGPVVVFQTQLIIPDSNSTDIIIYNMTTLPEPGEGCRQFGTGTTDMSTIPNFADVNFVIDYEMNFACLGFSGALDSYKDAMLLNFTSINMTSSDIANKLAGLGSTIQVDIGIPKNFEDSRIYVNTGAFAELNTSATIKFFGLPFSSNPAVIADNNSGISSTWVTNGYDSSINITTGNLTFNVGGFSGYNITDNAKPKVTIISPTSSYFTNSTILVSVLVNGTGTEPSYVSISNLSGGSAYVYNGAAVNSANCANISSSKETWNCTITMANVPETPQNLTITAYDYGGTTGNLNITTMKIAGNITKPVLLSQSASATASSATISYSANKSVNASVNYGTGTGLGSRTQNTAYSSSSSVSLSGLSSSTLYYYNITICDGANNCVTNGIYNFTTSAASSNGTTGSTGGTGGANTPINETVWIVSYYPSDSQLQEGYEKELLKNYKISFKIGNVYHYVGLIAVTNTTATVQVGSQVQEKMLNIGNEWRVDLNTTDSINFYDIYIKINSINGSRVNLIVKRINESYTPSTITTLPPSPATTTTTTTTTSPGAGQKLGEIAEAGTESIMKNLWLWVGIVVIVAIIGVLIAFWNKIAKSIWVKTNKNKNFSVNLK